MKNRIILTLVCLFSLVFIVYVFKLSDEIQKDAETITSSPNVLDVTDKLTTKLLVTDRNLSLKEHLDDKNWHEVKIPAYQIIKEPSYKEGNFAYYKIVVPKSEVDKLPKLKDELDIVFYQINFNRYEILVNGSFYRQYHPVSEEQSLTIIPLTSGKDNVILIKGHISPGNQGMNFRDQIYIGKSSEFYAIHKSYYKQAFVFPLIFVLAKGSVIFVFALIYLLLSVERFFEKSLLFSLCAIGEDILTGEFFETTLITLNTRVYLYNILNIGVNLFLFLFLADVINRKFDKRYVYGLTAVLAVVTFGMSYDILNTGKLFTFGSYLMTWNLISALVILFYIPQVLKKDKILFVVMSATLSMTIWGTFFAVNVGINFKMLGNLLLFFMVAYESFALFRRDQLDHQAKQIQLHEQEKDVAIGKTASILAHDVRRPLEQMKLILEKVTTSQVSPEFLLAARKDVDFSITSVNNQINDIMNYSKNRTVVLTDVSFYHVLAGSVKQVMTINKNMDITIEKDLQAQVQIQGDESLLTSALTNLVSNALEAIRDIGGKQQGTIKLSTSVDGNYFVFSIFNDGPTIPANMLSEIFRPLFTHGKEHGTGLGLASVMKTMQDHKGEIAVRNVGQAGVEFTLKFLVSDKSDNNSGSEILNHSRDYSYELKKEEKIGKRPLRIFLLDDDLQVHEYFQFLAQNLNFEVELTFVSHFEAAREAVKSKRFDLYILDYDLNGNKTGLDFYFESIPYLSREVVIHSNRDKVDLPKVNCRQFKKPMSPEDLAQLCESAWELRTKVLLVDDGPLTLMAWEMFHGAHNIQTIDSPEAAIDFISKGNKVDICVLDYYFDNSRMNGEALALKLKEIDQGLKIVLASNIDQFIPGHKNIHKNDFDIRSLR